MSARCPAMLQPPHAGAQPVRCRFLVEREHRVHYGFDAEPPRTPRQWFDSNGAAVIDTQGNRTRRGDAS